MSDARMNYERSPSLSQESDANDKGETPFNSAHLMAQQGDVERALELWRQSLDIYEQAGNIQGKAATLSMMAEVIERQGDVKGAGELHQQSLMLLEQIGDVKGQAITLSNMAALAWKQGNIEEMQKLSLEAAKSLAAVCAWPDLVTVLGNLGRIGSGDTIVFLAQALWLTLRVEVPVEDSLNSTAAVLVTIGVGHNIAPLLGSAALFFARTRGQQHPEQKALTQEAINMLGACAKARKIERQDQFEQWFASEGLNDPSRFMPILSHALEALVGDREWLFDRQLVGSK